MGLLRLQYYGHRIVSSVAKALPVTAPTKFLIISRGRSGSNLLLSLLRTHPRIRAWGEVVGEFLFQQPYLKRDILKLGPTDYVKRWFNRTAFEAAVGIKVLYYQVEDEYGQKWDVEGLPAVLDFLKSQKDIRVIHLKRRNRLKTMTSFRVAWQTEQYLEFNDQNNPADDIKINISAEEWEKDFNQIGAWEKLYDEAFADHPLLEIYYEDFVKDMPGYCDRVLEFLSVPKRPLSTPMKKQQKSPLSEVIENYAELKQHFASTPWAQFFKD